MNKVSVKSRSEYYAFSEFETTAFVRELKAVPDLLHALEIAQVYLSTHSLHAEDILREVTAALKKAKGE